MTPRFLVLPIALLALASVPAAIAHDAQGYGTVPFPTSCALAVQARFETALARLHDFDGPEDAFRTIAAEDPRCAIAWWGAAMAVRGNPLAGAPDAATLKTGQALLAKARAVESLKDRPTSPREAGLIEALGTYYRDPAEPHAARTRAYETAMKRLASTYPDDPDVQSLAAPAILEAVDLTDTTYARQREAGRILETVWAAHPDHPGAPHYLIHAYDYAPLAERALPAARRYAAIASASVHAQHMPSHVYSMLGLWRDSIAANQAAARLLLADGEGGRHEAHHGGAPPPGVARLEVADPHGLDFIAYAHLQLGQDAAVARMLARAAPSEERTLVEARYRLERGDWAGAAAMPLRAPSPLDGVTVRFVRALGAARSGRPVRRIRAEIAALLALREPVERAEGAYWAGLVDVYAAAAQAWLAWREGRTDAALTLMREAAQRDEGREKHILLENKLVPMRELYGEMLLEAGRPDEALAAFEASLSSAPNRLRSHLGAARAAAALGRSDDAKRSYAKIIALATDAAPGRPEIAEARRSER